jgi:hypothetical protein
MKRIEAAPAVTTITILRFYSTRGQQDASIVAARDANEAAGPHKRWQKSHKARGVKFGRPPSLTPTSAKKPSSGLRKALQAFRRDSPALPNSVGFAERGGNKPEAALQLR